MFIKKPRKVWKLWILSFNFLHLWLCRRMAWRCGGATVGSASLWRRREMADLTARTGEQKNLLTVIWYICEQLGYVNEMQMTYQHFFKVQVNHVQSESGLTRCPWTWLGGRFSSRRSPSSLWACASVLAAGGTCLLRLNLRISLVCRGYLSHLTMVHLLCWPNALVMVMSLCSQCEDLCDFFLVRSLANTNCKGCFHCQFCRSDNKCQVKLIIPKMKLL